MAQQTTSVAALPLAGRVAIVTGSSRGIGRAIALHLSSLGSRLVINYSSNSASAEQLVTEINNSSSSSSKSLIAIAVKADVSNAGEVKSLFDAAENSFSTKPHILVHCAGVLDSKYPTIAETTEADWDNTFNINTKGAFLCCREAANRLSRGGGGRIVCLTTSLVAALSPKYGAYTASKAAVEAMVKILAKELKGTGITANCVAPGPVATEMFFAGKTEEMIQRLVDMNPMGRLGETKDIAPMVGFLCTDGGEWVNGQVIRVNGGYVS